MASKLMGTEWSTLPENVARIEASRGEAVLDLPTPDLSGRRMAHPIAAILRDGVLYGGRGGLPTIPVDFATYEEFLGARIILPTPWVELAVEPVEVLPTPEPAVPVKPVASEPEPKGRLKGRSSRRGGDTGPEAV